VKTGHHPWNPQRRKPRWEAPSEPVPKAVTLPERTRKVNDHYALQPAVQRVLSRPQSNTLNTFKYPRLVLPRDRSRMDKRQAQSAIDHNCTRGSGQIAACVYRMAVGCAVPSVLRVPCPCDSPLRWYPPSAKRRLDQSASHSLQAESYTRHRPHLASVKT